MYWVNKDSKLMFGKEEKPISYGERIPKGKLSTERTEYFKKLGWISENKPGVEAPVSVKGKSK